MLLKSVITNRKSDDHARLLWNSLDVWNFHSEGFAALLYSINNSANVIV